MEGTTPRLNPWAVGIIAALLVAHVLARYLLGWGHHKDWQGVHVAVGLLYVAGVLAWFHGAAVLRRLDCSARWIVAVGVGCYLLFWYFGRSDTYIWTVKTWIPPSGALAPVFPFIYLSVCGIVLRLLVPFTLGARLAGRPAASLGLWSSREQRLAGVWMVYLGLFLVVLPVLFMAAESPAFLQKYPLARAMIGADGAIAWEHFLGYQAFYLLIFLSGEALYRGFITFGLEKQLGLYAIAIMLVPYVFSHFGKPLAEALGAIASGSILAFLALKHRSVWLGVGLHYAVALSMDLLALRGNGFVLR